MRLYKLTQPERVQHRVAIRNIGIIPFPVWETRRQIAGIAKEGDVVDLKPKLLDIDGSFRSLQVLPGRRVLKAIVGDDYGFMATESEGTVNAENINSDPELKSAYWYGEKLEIVNGIYSRLETERRWAIDWKGLYCEERHRLGRRYASGDQEVLEPDLGLMEGGVVAIMGEGSVRIAACESGRYYLQGSELVRGNEINQHDRLREQFHFVGSERR